MSDVYEGQCFCGTVKIRVTGKPNAMGYCHCKDCRAWSAGPVNAFTLWPRDAVEVVEGKEHLAVFQKNPTSDRMYCGKCGGHVMTDHVPGDFTDVYAATIPGLRFEPVVHVNYESSVLQIKDGLPKLKDFPTEMGGSGESMPE